MSSIWTQDEFNALSILMGCPILTQPASSEGELGGTGSADQPQQEQEGEPAPDIKPPLPQEIPAPQAPQPEITPFQTPPPVDPDLPQPEA